MDDMKILHLTLNKKAFEVMVTGEKTKEFRKPSKWMLSRIRTKEGTPKVYDYVKFTNGYGNDKPYFIAPFRYARLSNYRFQDKFTNGLEVDVLKGDVIIDLGYVTEKGNIMRQL